jgi:hypothetical protein
MKIFIIMLLHYTNSFQIFLLSGIFFTPECPAQYKISTTTVTLPGETIENNKTDEAYLVACSFFELSATDNRCEWEKLLSKECFKKNIPKDFVDRWFQKLSTTKNPCYIIRENTAPRTNQKIFSYSCTPDSKPANSLVLVRENGNWTVFQIRF